ncbi:hypothetical protein [Chthonobacter albigriseus]|uniref:hypothetical protein n=1 Tax=Chthonobacter albigriseus TaxID=1683161 RepID=UPI0015EF714E|nr:hypothetical protein [Chthonobacter albigriseus]
MKALHVFGSRQFWSLSNLNAIVGGVLTVVAGIASVIYADDARRRIDAADEELAILRGSIQAIDRAVSEYQLFVTTGALITAVVHTDSLSPSYRPEFVQLIDTSRRQPIRAVVAEIQAFVPNPPFSIAKFDEVASAASRGSEALNELVRYESDVLTFGRRLQTELIKQTEDKDKLKETASRDRDYYTFVGFVLQQIGFVIVLLGNIVVPIIGGHDRALKVERLSQTGDQ